MLACRQSQVRTTDKEKKQTKKGEREKERRNLQKKKNEVGCNLLGYLYLILRSPKPPFTRSYHSTEFTILLIKLWLIQTI